MNLQERIPGIEKTPIVAILRKLDPELISNVGRGIAAGGIRVAEVTLDSKDALRQIATMAEIDSLTVGAGSVVEPHQVEAARGAGATFIVSPITSAAVAEACAEHRLPYLPGAATPTEIHLAVALGATAVKVFPAVQLGGPEYIKAIRSPLGDPILVPTGGVDLDNARAFFDAGATAIGVGSSLLGDADPSDVESVAAQTKQWIEAVR